MRKFLTAFVAATAIAASAIATPATAQGWYGAGWHGSWGWGPGPFIGGLAAGPYPTGHYVFAPGPYPGRACVWQLVWNGWVWVRGCV